MGTVFAVLIYGFPMILLLFEWGLRTIIGVDTWGFTGPTLAATGLSFLVPLAKPKVISKDTTSPGTVLVSPTDQAFLGVVWLLVLAFLFVWATTCFISLRHPDYVLWGMSEHFVIGLGAYGVSLIMTAVKELM